MNPHRILAAATAILLSACGATSAATTASTGPLASAPTVAAATTTPPPATTSTPTTTSTIAASTTAIAVIDDPSVLAGKDWAAIVQHLGRRRQALYANPVDDPAVYGTICAAGDNPCTSALRTQIASLAEQGLRISGAAPFEVLHDSVLENVEDGESVDTARIVTVVVTVQRSPDSGSLVDGTGTIQAELESDAPSGESPRTRVSLVRTAPGSEWRILEQTAAGQSSA